MNSIIDDYPAGFPTAQGPPYLSLYQPTHRSHPDRQQDPIRFRNLVRALEESLREVYPAREIGRLLEPFHALAADGDFWSHTGDGLAVLGATDVFRVYRLQRSVPELAVVADSFHTKPLLRILQSVDRYQILGVSRQMIRLFEGNRDALEGRVRHGSAEDDYRCPRRGHHRAGCDCVFVWQGWRPCTVRRARLKNDEKQADAERFFRVVDAPFSSIIRGHRVCR